MEELPTPELLPCWTRRDAVKEIWDKSKGPLEILLAVGIGAAIYKITSYDVDGILKFTAGAGGVIALANLTRCSVRDILFYREAYRSVHRNLDNLSNASSRRYLNL